MKLSNFSIEPAFATPKSVPPSYLETVQNIVSDLLNSFTQEGALTLQKDCQALYQWILKQLPIVQAPSLEFSEKSFPLTFLCPAEYTQGAGCYINDSLSRWLFPGRQLRIFGEMMLHFAFSKCPDIKFLFLQKIVSFNDKEEFLAIQQNLPPLIREIKVNIMAVYQARYITSLRSYSHNHKSLLIQENINSLLNSSDKNLFDQMQIFIGKLASEEKLNEVKKNLTHLLNARPKSFGRDIFHEMTQYAAIFNDPFSTQRSSKHVSRVIAYQYLFKKTIQDKVQKFPSERHLSFKAIRCPLKGKGHIVSLSIAFNFLRETERFELRHLLEAVKLSLPEAEFVEGSFVIDRRHDKIVFLYAEFAKPLFRPFSPLEIKRLRLRLPPELIRQIETMTHPIFMPRNEEEILRNLIILSKEIKYTRDLPQASIHYEKQTDTHLFFIVIIARLKLDKTSPLPEILPKVDRTLKIDIDDIRIVGYLKQKHPKEAAVLHVTMEKTPFFRPDYSVDLLRARQRIVSKLTQSFGEFRDFNGGMIVQQDEALSNLRTSLGSPSPQTEFLLENYFYSLRPALMQTIHGPLCLQAHFEILLSLQSSALGGESYSLHGEKQGHHYLLWIRGAAPTFKDEVMNAVGLPSNDLTVSFLQISNQAALGFIVRLKSGESEIPFKRKVEEALEKWSKTFSCPIYGTAS
jgi:hypothetical protein